MPLNKETYIVRLLLFYKDGIGIKLPTKVNTPLKNNQTNTKNHSNRRLYTYLAQ